MGKISFSYFLSGILGEIFPANGMPYTCKYTRSSSPRPKLSGKVKTFDVLYLYQDTVAKLTISHMTRQNNIYIYIYIQYILIYSTIHSHRKRYEGPIGVEQVV